MAACDPSDKEEQEDSDSNKDEGKQSDDPSKAPEDEHPACLEDTVLVPPHEKTAAETRTTASQDVDLHAGEDDID